MKSKNTLFTLTFTLITAGILANGSAFALARETPATLSFSNQTIEANVHKIHATALLPEEVGSLMIGGAAAGDFNKDGWTDFFVTGGGLEPDALFLNQGDGTFEDIAEEAGLATYHVGSGATVGDYNGDGWPDIYVTSFGSPEATGPGQHRLYRNNGDLTFTEVAAEAGVEQTSSEVADGFGAAFGDYDLDGDLDLFAAGWIKDSKGNRLFRNNGDGTFSDVTTSAGIIDDGIRGFSPCFADMDGDRYPELLLAADFGTSRYFVNNGDGTFSDRTPESNTSHESNGMGTAIGDFNNDGLLDWYVTSIYDPENRGDGNKLYINNGDHRFTEIAEPSGVDNGSWGWGTAAADLNHDGLLDLVETNGWHDIPKFTAIPSKVWLQRTDGTFNEVAAETGFDHNLDGRGLFRFDFDNDGDQDFVVTAVDDELRLYRNDLSGTDTNWLRITLDTSDHPGLAPNGFGSTVRVRTGDQTYTRYVTGCSHYLTQSEPSAHFGLGDSTTVDEVQVAWSDGSSTVLTDVEANQTLTISAPPSGTIFLPLIEK